MIKFHKPEVSDEKIYYNEKLDRYVKFDNANITTTKFKEMLKKIVSIKKKLMILIKINILIYKKDLI